MGNAGSVDGGVEHAPHTVAQDSGALVVKTEDGRETSCVYRSASHPTELVRSLLDNSLQNAVDILKRGMAISGNEGYLGRRSTRNPAVYEWLTYNEVYEQACKIGAVLIKLNLVEQQSYNDEYPQARQMRVLGICSRNRPEWFITDWMCCVYNITSCPVYETLGEAGMNVMLVQTQCSMIAGSIANLEFVIKLLEKRSDFSDINLKHFLSFDNEVPVDIKNRITGLGLKLVTWQDILDEAERLGPIEVPEPPKPEDVCSLCYTSGTTGVPKGVLITQRAFASNISAALRGPLYRQGLDIDANDMYMSYLPLAHVLERILCCIVTACGGKLAIYSGDTRTLLDDIKVARPTVFASVPRLFMRINDRIQSGLAANSSVVRYLFDVGMQSKLQRLREKGQTTHPVWDALIFRKVAALMGGRLRYMLTGGAALEKNIQERMACLFSCPLLEGYGLTETLGATFIRRADDCIYGHIGMPLASAEMKLESVAEMNYSVTNNPPAGELLVRGYTVFPNYFLNAEATREAFTPDGWFRTGDIAMRLNEGGRIKIIDRRKNMFKMSQGEYVTPDKIENIYSQIPIISQIFCYGDSSRVSLVGIIVLDEEELKRWVKEQKQNRNPDFVSFEFTPMTEPGPSNTTIAIADIERLAKSSALQAHLVAQMENIAKELHLNGFEKVKKFHISPEPFSTENGTLTPTFKLKRNVARTVFYDEIESLYKELGEYHEASA